MKEQFQENVSPDIKDKLLFQRVLKMILFCQIYATKKETTFTEK